MAKKSVSYSGAQEKYIYPYPSHYGSHASMIDQEATDKLGDPKLVVLKDTALTKQTLKEGEAPPHSAFPDGMPEGLYITERSRLDNGSADPNRYPSSRLKILMSSKKEKEKAAK